MEQTGLPFLPLSAFRILRGAKPEKGFRISYRHFAGNFPHHCAKIAREERMKAWRPAENGRRRLQARVSIISEKLTTKEAGKGVCDAQNAMVR